MTTPSAPVAAADGGDAAELLKHVERLLARSLVCWRIVGRVTRVAHDGAADGGTAALVIDGLGHRVRIERAPAALPFRWLVTVDGRQRPAISVVAVLRQVRLALDPGYAKTRVRIAPMPVLTASAGS